MTIMLLGAGERTIDEFTMGTLLLGSGTAQESALGVELPNVQLVEIGGHRFLQEGEMDETSLIFRTIHSVYMDKTLEKSKPIDPNRLSLGIAESDNPNPRALDEILEMLVEEETPFSGSRFDLTDLAQAPVDITVILPGGSTERSTDEVRQIRKLAVLSIANVFSSEPQKRRAITALCQTQPPITAREPEPVFWAGHIEKRGVSALTTGVTGPELSRITTPLMY